MKIERGIQVLFISTIYPWMNICIQNECFMLLFWISFYIKSFYWFVIHLINYFCNTHFNTLQYEMTVTDWRGRINGVSLEGFWGSLKSWGLFFLSEKCQISATVSVLITVIFNRTVTGLISTKIIIFIQALHPQISHGGLIILNLMCNYTFCYS